MFSLLCFYLKHMTNELLVKTYKKENQKWLRNPLRAEISKTCPKFRAAGGGNQPPLLGCRPSLQGLLPPRSAKITLFWNQGLAIQQDRMKRKNLNPRFSPRSR
jgi:hypothetical protein